ncbi:MAG: hypothetical protein ACRER3_11960 [Pseudomonas fluorescens]
MPAVIDAASQQEVEVAQFRKSDFEDLEAWAEEVGISTDELASQIVGRASRFLLQRRETKAGNNVVPFGPLR